MNNCKLFETLSRCNTSLNKEHNPKSYSCSEECPWYGKCFYNIECPPENSKLQEFFGGWQKYCVYEINDKKCQLESNGYIVLNILHLLSPFKVDDIVIFRIAKKNKDDNKYSIRYICKQGNKSNTCANIKQLNEHINKKCEYSGRYIIQKDFIINKKDIMENEVEE